MNSPPTLLLLGVSHDLIDDNLYNIVSSSSGVDGFKMLLKDAANYEAVVIGPHLKDVQPLYLVHKINCCSSLRILPIIIEANKGSNEEITACIQAGAHYYLDKDSELIDQILTSAIRDHLRYQEAASSIYPLPAGSSLVEATFKIKTLPEAQAAAAIMAQTCPNPRLAAVALAELMINGIEHGNLGISFADKTRLYKSKKWLEEIERRLLLPTNREKYVTAHFKKTRDTIVIKIRDQGKGFSWNKYETLGVNRVYNTHGRGIVLAKNLAFQSMTYQGNGNEVECIIQLI